MHYVTARGVDVKDGKYTVRSVYPTRKSTSTHKIEVINGRVHSDKVSYTLSVKDFFHDHEIVE